MSSTCFSDSNVKVVLRWTARLLAGALVGLDFVILIGEGGFNPSQLTTAEALLMALFLTTCGGLVIGWRWPLAGGVLSTAGILGFYAVEFGLKGRFPSGPVFPLMLLAGILFLFSAISKRPKSAS